MSKQKPRVALHGPFVIPGAASLPTSDGRGAAAHRLTMCCPGYADLGPVLNVGVLGGSVLGLLVMIPIWIPGNSSCL